jgi:hypothetical protein
MSTTEDVIASCSFCGKPSTDVHKLVAGPGVFICNECVDLSATVIAETTPEEAAVHRARFLEPSAEDLLDMLPPLAQSVARVEGELTRSVSLLRTKGVGWLQIANALQTSAEAARQRFEATPPA